MPRFKLTPRRCCVAPVLPRRGAHFVDLVSDSSSVEEIITPSPPPQRQGAHFVDYLVSDSSSVEEITISSPPQQAGAHFVDLVSDSSSSVEEITPSSPPQPGAHLVDYLVSDSSSVEEISPSSPQRGPQGASSVPLLGPIVINQSLISIRNMAANDAGNSDSSSSSSLPQSPVGKKGRGPTQLKGLTARRVRGPVRIEFDDDLNPIGPDEDRFVSYIGYLSRTHVGINIPNWRKVDQTTRDMILGTNLAEAAKSDPSIVVQSPRRPQRHLKWKAGRIKKGGGYVNTTVEGIARKIDELSQQSKEGSFTSSGRMDILATAIGKPDHPGQVRGAEGVGLSRYFGRASPHSRPSEELVAKVRQELTQSITEEVKQQLQLQQLDQSLHFDQRLEEMAELHRQEMAEQRRLIAEQQRYFESMLSS
ncbi:hypothetical protein K1719_039356 [Acacia pycnantha]|nr:hypothetical protein K1719_039356 [Acacia pycnantha]